MSRLQVADLSLLLGERQVLSHVSFVAGSGEMIALVGPNGAGKTSLLRCLAGLVASTGRILLDGQDAKVVQRAERARMMGYLPQGHMVHWPLAVRDIVALGRFPLGAHDPAHLSADDRAAIHQAMEASDTAQFADRLTTALSEGERARVALARVLALNAAILLADEPTAALDPRHQIGVMECLANVARQGGLVMVVTHDLVLAARYCGRIIVLDDGVLKADGPARVALNDAVLRDIFQVSAAHLLVEGRDLAIPWRAL